MKRSRLNPSATFDRRTGMLTITWKLDRHDCEEIGYALKCAGQNDRGAVTDHGFYDDGCAFIEMAEEVDIYED